MSEENERSDLDRTEELFAFLQGIQPEGHKIKDIPKLTPEQAWTVIWYLGNQYWQVTDHVYRCDVCGDLYDGDESGECMDYGRAPYFFCDECAQGDEATAKRRLGRRLEQRATKQAKEFRKSQSQAL